VKPLLKTLFAFYGVLLVSCSHGPDSVFTEISPSASNINFRNDIEETKEQNILTYE
jgi:hypothetical protein